MMIYRVDEVYDNKINPITKCRYDSSWLILTLVYSNGNPLFVGDDNGGAYTIKISKIAHDDWRLAVGDFIDYCNSNNINAILEMTQADFDDTIQYYKGHSFNEKILRAYEPKMLIHSTTMENWINIQRDGMLKSWNILKNEKTTFEERPIGTQLGDPTSFSDVILIKNTPDLELKNLSFFQRNT